MRTIRDMISRGRVGPRREVVRYFYVPDGNGGLVRETAVIAITNPDRIGPFEMTRTVTYGEWTMDATDERSTL
jgi:hypothetical protein